MATDWRRGVAILLVIPALAFLSATLVVGTDERVLAARAGVFAVSVVFLLRRPLEGPSWSGWSALAACTIVALALAVGTLGDPGRAVLFTALVATSEEIAFRQYALNFVLGGSSRARSIFVASLATSAAFATSHFVSGTLAWSVTAWTGFAGAAACLVAVRLSAGLATAIAVHFTVNELIRTRMLGILVLPGSDLLILVAVGAPVLTALGIPLLSRARTRSADSASTAQNPAT